MPYILIWTIPTFVAVIKVWIPPFSAEVKEWVELYIHTPNTPSLHGAQLKKHRDNFTFTFTFTPLKDKYWTECKQRRIDKTPHGWHNNADNERTYATVGRKRILHKLKMTECFVYSLSSHVSIHCSR
jgi:hypothetical protein